MIMMTMMMMMIIIIIMIRIMIMMTVVIIVMMVMMVVILVIWPCSARLTARLISASSSRSYTSLVCLPNVAATDGAQCWITGWGTLQSGGSHPENLQQASVPIVSHETCVADYDSSSIDASMVCAGYDAGGKDSCQGDSGGPLVCESGGSYYLHGVTSWGYGCASADYYGVYARVHHLRSWINQKMAEN